MATVFGPMTRYSRGERCRRTAAQCDPGHVRDFPGNRVGTGGRDGKRRSPIGRFERIIYARDRCRYTHRRRTRPFGTR